MPSHLKIVFALVLFSFSLLAFAQEADSPLETPEETAGEQPDVPSAGDLDAGEVESLEGGGETQTEEIAGDTESLVEDAISDETETAGAQAKFRLKSIDFESKEKTSVSALKRNIVDIDYERIFESQEEMEKYLYDVYQELENTRLLENIQYSYSIAGSEDGVSLVAAQYSFEDSYSIIVFPKPTFDTNEGIEIKLKMKDNNFIGLMNDLNVDLNMNFGDEDEPDNYSKVYVGFNFDYDLPFEVGVTENTWSNDFEFKWQIDAEEPEFSYETGITVGIPFGGLHKLQLSFTQAINKDLDYEKYGDGLYFVETARVALPLFVGYIGNTAAVTYTPSVTLTYNWDHDGINDANDDLNQTPFLKPGQTIAVDNVDWVDGNNFRTGYYMSASQYIGWDFAADTLDENLVPSVEGDLELFKSFKYVGFAVRIQGFAGRNTTFNVGDEIRGAPDNQAFKGYEIDEDNYALETPGAIVFNFDMPIHIVTTHWLDWSYAIFGDYETKPKAIRAIALVPRQIMKYVDFELQFSPFVDVGLIKNRATGTMMSLTEGIYTCGLEVLVYPAKWKSFVVRASLGVDVSKKILNGHMDFDSSWRKGKAWEAFIGLGLQY